MSLTVNPIIGDMSTEKMDLDNLSEQDRIQTHLKFVEQYLSRQTKGKSPEAIEKRKEILQHLADYYEKGIFPKNTAYAGKRKPCFIDGEGNICAVGYLVEQTAGRSTAEAINAKFQYEELMNIQDEALNSWVAQSGFSKKEIAMIQPTYGGTDVIEPRHAATTATLTGINLGTMLITGLNMTSNNYRAVPWIGLASGLSSALYGFTEIRTPYSIGNLKLKTDMLNLGMGIASTTISIARLVRKPQNNKSYSLQPTTIIFNNQMAYGLQFKKTLN